MRSTTDHIRTPLYTPTEAQKARDYVPKYHVFYDPTWGVPRVESVPLGMGATGHEAAGSSDE